jgi:aminocarboxymuconate-semialdehyde decarboxylase
VPAAPTIDIHAHFYPERYLAMVAEEGPAAGVRVDRSDARGPIIWMTDGTRIGPLRTAFVDLDVRRKEMDRQGVRVHALSLTLPMVDWAGSDLGGRLARAVNDAIAQAHTAFPDRFAGLATLPMQDPPRAVAEMERAAALPGMRGIYIGTNIAGRDLSEPAFFPVWERAQALRWPVFLHPYNVLGLPRLSRYYLHNLLGNPFDTATAAAHLIFGGVLDRFPRLDVCLPHAGGALPWVIGRLRRGWEKIAACREIKRPPTGYLKRFTYDTISHSPDALTYLIRAVGPGRVMLGSDYCFDLGYDRPVQVVTALRGVSAAAKRGILGGNAARLLRLRGLA